MDEQLKFELATEITLRVMRALSAADEDANGIPIGVSARHVHLTEEALSVLFGKGHALTPVKTLMGGQYAAEECVTVVGANLRAMEKVRIIGPLRSFSQVEISRTDSFALGVSPPVRDSGDLQGAAAVTLVGPCGVVYLEAGCIIAKRHVHMSPADAARFGVSDRQIVRIGLQGGRGGIMEHVLVRVAASFTLEMHIDTDEANAFGVANGACGFIVKHGQQ